MVSHKWQLTATPQPSSTGGIAFLPTWLTPVTCFSQWDMGRVDVGEGFKNACAVGFRAFCHEIVGEDKFLLYPFMFSKWGPVDSTNRRRITRRKGIIFINILHV